MVLPISDKQADSIGRARADASRSQINLWHGSVRSGKTIGSLFAFLMRVAEAPDSGEIVIIGRTRDTVFRNLVAPMQDVSLFGPMVEQVVGNRGAPTITILGRRVHVIGASDVRAEAIIRGMTINTSYVDEATLVAEDFFSMLMSRHSVPGAWCGLTTNPDGPRHYLKTKFIDRAEEMGHRVFHFCLEDNEAYLPDGYIDALKRQYTGLWYDRFIDGRWSLAEGVIFDQFDPARHVVDTVPPVRRVIALGIDYGTTNPTAGVLAGLTDDGRLCLMAEWAPPAGTDTDLSARLREWMGHQPAPEYVWVDPAAASFKLQLHRDGVRRVGNADNHVVDGIRTMAGLFATDQLIIHESCTNLLDEIPGYVWDGKAADKGADKPIKLDDHFTDAARYAVHTTRALWMTQLTNPLEVAGSDE